MGTTFGLCAALAGAACGDAENPKPQGLDELGVNESELGVAVGDCSSGTGGWTSTNKTLTLGLVNGTSNTVVISAPSGILKVNGYTCVSSGGTVLTTANVTKLLVNGTTGDDKIILDTLAGGFGSIVATTGGGITVDGGAHVNGDAVMLRGSASADAWVMGDSNAGDHFVDLTADAIADVMVKNCESATVSLGAGNDSFYGTGQGSKAVNASRLASGVTSLVAVGATFPLTVYGGDGNDTMQGGNADDTLYGGPGDDVFKTAATADGADKYYGDADAASNAQGDTIDYSARNASLTITIGPAPSQQTPDPADANDGDGAAGQNGEGDDVKYSVENVTGGKVADTITGSDKSNFIKGGAGDDKINGGVAGSSCASDKDTLEGDDGNDTFDMSATPDCGDVVLGGNGSDVVDYSARTASLTITLDLNANDGETVNNASEGDNVKDAEIVLGGSHADTITGGALDDELHGGAGDDVISGGAGNDILVGDDGNDTLNGNAGDDTFDEGLVDAYPAGNAQAQSPLSKGAGDDKINGGAGTNSADYSERTADLTITMCADPTTLTGAPASQAAECNDSDGDPANTENDNVANVSVVYGGTGADTLTGTAGDDALYGGSGDNVLDGQAGDDICINDGAVTTPPANCEVF
jgi:Ca2+-binding RTX toxin-like protein